MAPVTAIFAGLYLDDIAGRVEARHYARDPAGTSLSGFRAVQTSCNLLSLFFWWYRGAALVFTGIGAWRSSLPTPICCRANFLR
jgi:uncharacterized protein involved in cysteine biosynthesis